MNTYEILSTDCHEVIIVGGGTCGLAIASRLCEDTPGSIFTEDEHQRFHWLKQRGGKVNLVNRSLTSKTSFKPPSGQSLYKPRTKYLPHEILVLDVVSDSWLGQWDHQFATCLIPFLRSPMFFHPDPVNIDAMVTYAYLTKREGPEHIKEIDNVVGKEYSKHQQKKLRKKGIKKNPAPSSGNSSVTHNSMGLVDINMRDWKDYYRPSTPFFRDFCQDVINRYNLHQCVKKDKVVDIEYCFLNFVDSGQSGKGFVVRTESGKEYPCKACVVTSGHAGDINYPIRPFHTSTEKNLEGSCHTTHIFLKQVSDFPNNRIMDKIKKNVPNSLVVVGGGLTSAQLIDVAIRKGVQKCYLLLRGPMKIKDFDFHLEWVTKYKNVKKSAFYILESDEQRYQMIQEAREGGSLNPEYYKKTMNHVKSGKLELLKFTTITEQCWKEDSKTWDLTLTTKPNKHNSLLPYGEAESTTRNLVDVDYIYFATGIQANLKSLGFLDSIIDSHPIDIIHGLPCLTDNLQWNDEIPLFMSGKNAQLKMGPASANLDGARLGAERVGWSLQDMRSRGDFEWDDSEQCISECPVCNSVTSGSDSEDSNYSFIEKASTNSSVSSEIFENEKVKISSFDMRLKLATGQANWYSILENED